MFKMFHYPPPQTFSVESSRSPDTLMVVVTHLTRYTLAHPGGVYLRAGEVVERAFKWYLHNSSVIFSILLSIVHLLYILVGFSFLM